MPERKPATSSPTLLSVALTAVDLLVRRNAILAARLSYVAPVQYAVARREIREIESDEAAA